jgi:hypothetical protein
MRLPPAARAEANASSAAASSSSSFSEAAGERHADRHADPQLAGRGLDRARSEQPPQRVGKGGRAGLVGVGQDRQEAIAPHAAKRVGAPHPQAQSERNLLQHLVAEVQSVVAVDRREAVEVEEHDGHRVLVALRLGRLDPQALQDGAASRDAGQPVDAGQLRQLHPLQLDGPARLHQLLDRAAQLARKARRLLGLGEAPKVLRRVAGSWCHFGGDGAGRSSDPGPRVARVSQRAPGHGHEADDRLDAARACRGQGRQSRSCQAGGEQRARDDAGRRQGRRQAEQPGPGVAGLREQHRRSQGGLDEDEEEDPPQRGAGRGYRQGLAAELRGQEQDAGDDRRRANPAVREPGSARLHRPQRAHRQARRQAAEGRGPQPGRPVGAPHAALQAGKHGPGDEQCRGAAEGRKQPPQALLRGEQWREEAQQCDGRRCQRDGGETARQRDGVGARDGLGGREAGGPEVSVQGHPGWCEGAPRVLDRSRGRAIVRTGARRAAGLCSGHAGAARHVPRPLPGIDR